VKNDKIFLSDAERTVITGLGHPLYTAEFLEEWINRDDSIFTNAIAALQAVAAKGFYEAVQRMIEVGPPPDNRRPET
jgi:hypothetical protein